MKLYMKQKIFSWSDTFTVKDAAGEDKYFIEGEVFSFGKKLHVYDRSGREVAFIHQKLWSFLPRYMVAVNGIDVAEIVKEFTFLRPKYSILGPGWDVSGSFWEHDYEVTENGRPVVSIRKEWMTWGDTYELDIADPGNEVMALAVVLAIDCVLDAQQNANNN